ncbi:hypothetical protein A7X85_26860 [Streptomyces sp. ST1015]|nr:hypothetical protein A7X85_26860 [Streptomyces sp. ST1015]
MNSGQSVRRDRRNPRSFPVGVRGGGLNCRPVCACRAPARGTHGCVNRSLTH